MPNVTTRKYAPMPQSTNRPPIQQIYLCSHLSPAILQISVASQNSVIFGKFSIYLHISNFYFTYYCSPTFVHTEVLRPPRASLRSILSHLNFIARPSTSPSTISSRVYCVFEPPNSNVHAPLSISLSAQFHHPRLSPSDLLHFYAVCYLFFTFIRCAFVLPYRCVLSIVLQVPQQFCAHSIRPFNPTICLTLALPAPAVLLHVVTVIMASNIIYIIKFTRAPMSFSFSSLSGDGTHTNMAALGNKTL